MGLLEVLRGAVATANTVTKPFQVWVSYSRFTGDDGMGTRTYATATLLRAVINPSNRTVKSTGGDLVASSCSVAFLDVAAVSAATAGAGIGDYDQIVLPDGRTGPIVSIKGFLDPGTNRPIATEVFLG